MQKHQASIYLVKLDKERWNLNKMFVKPPHKLDEEAGIQTMHAPKTRSKSWMGSEGYKTIWPKSAKLDGQEVKKVCQS